jgi:hypothetical protein
MDKPVPEMSLIHRTAIRIMLVAMLFATTEMA